MACSCSRIGKTRKMRYNKKGLINLIGDGAKITLGYVAGRAIVQRIPQATASPGISAAVQLGLGVIASTQRNDLIKKAGTGMAVGGVIDLVKAVGGQQLTSQLGLAGFRYQLEAGSSYTPGVAGGNVFRQNSLNGVDVTY